MQESIYSKAGPNNLKLEEQVIGCLLLRPEKLNLAKDLLGNMGSQVFYNSSMRLIYEALLRMEEEEVPIDIVLARSFIKEKFKEKIPPVLFADLINNVVSLKPLEYNLKKIRALYQKRQIQEISLKTLRVVDNGADVEQIKQDLIESLVKIKTREEREEPKTLKQLLESEIPATPYLIGPGLLPKQGYTMIIGKAKEGKTMLALSIALSLAEGVSLFLKESTKMGLFSVPEKAKTLFLFRENAESTLKEITRKQKKGLEKLLHRRIKNESLNSIKFLRPKTVYLDTIEGERELDRILKDNPIDLVVIDPLSRFIAKNMNEMQTVIAIANFLDDIGAKYGCTFLLLHHFRKETAGEKIQEDPFEKITGSAGWRNSFVSGVAMERKSESRSRNIKKLSFEFRNTESPEPITILRDPESLLFLPVTEEEALQGCSSVNMLADLIKKEFKNGVRYNVIIDIGSKKFGVGKSRIKTLLNYAKKDGLIAKGKGKEGKYYALSSLIS